jgi:hypothetical protein
VGLVTGYLVSRASSPNPCTAGTSDGTDAMINAFHNQVGVITGRAPP